MMAKDTEPMQKVSIIPDGPVLAAVVVFLATVVVLLLLLLLGVGVVADKSRL